MKNIKDITLSIFAVIGFVALLSSFTQEVVYTEKQISNGTPESHKFEIYMMDTGETHYNWLLNKETGQVWRLRKNGEQLGMTVRDTN